ncbi:MAG: dCTP deaminase [Candidatus Nomurabacteria bacterium GW2011_GWF2_35_66]|uniref:dCTP deaminase n=1 Tax=Candidatus Nomurabacteria bacterium GW2011_GWE1_35_16 TaxID=1618761 RepID=A0A0G0DV35_9BACT|nr:MAG: dCTP deaminase [Candidatus Nomurabacteria bacterium GW2011_GWF1_34_20]KKP63673.1 MAG: dCTP deaminase [Candidatus Nomurabacteria bacterium GW2011_GWE2_34_25]KKP66875.1 MAG: dCTP deaminase [Candidatus Nomurabacteria bacterium GW2011_GWE1_35_16]KKP83501.1 MAG: dCTP deaminase [Candidatus Nomurabacteria bacterium GW2011_GWF2_35_66]HAE36567.1 dCTP deaminase [Candidatus Nomurabacteria bacterium]
MILSDAKILEKIDSGEIVITPFDISNMGGNSYDVHLSKYFAQYIDKEIDAKKHNEVKHFEISEEGFVLKPGELYLASTLEYTESHNHVPFLEGKSSTGRLGIDIHATAGKGDVGFCGFWTLEISTSIPVRIYPGMPIGQLIYYVVEGEVERRYDKKASAKYSHQDKLPKESMMWKNF